MFLVMLHIHMTRKQILVCTINQMNTIQLNQYYICGGVGMYNTLPMLKMYRVKVFSLLLVCKGIVFILFET